jgi:hypothetical protein
MEWKNRQYTSKIIKANKTTLQISTVTPAQYSSFYHCIRKQLIPYCGKWAPIFLPSNHWKFWDYYFQTSVSNHKMCTIFLHKFQTFFYLQTGLTWKLIYIFLWFSARPDRPWGPPSLLYNGYRVFPGSKERPGRDADHSPPSSAKVLEE